MSNHHDPSSASHLSTPGKFGRREFVRRAAMLAGAGVAAPWALDLAGLTSAGGASAQSDYKALVCVFMYGGNDHWNTIVPYDPTSYADYTALRGGLAVPREELLPIDPTGFTNNGRQVAFAPRLGRLPETNPDATYDFDRLYRAQRLAVLSNVGTLLGPVTKAEAQIRSNQPPQLFSHNDQQSLWQSSAPEGSTTGWGGRLADLMLDDNGDDAVFTSISVAGNAVMLAGRNAVQYQLNPGEGTALSPGGVTQLQSSFASDSVVAGLDEILRLEGDGPFATSYSATTRRALSSAERLSTALDASPAVIDVPDRRLGAQLEMVSRLIDAGRNQLGLKRQVFFVSLGGFDHHDDLMADHPNLLRNINESISAFYEATEELGIADEVTTFTASDFGRTLVSNGDGSDHGWGAHHVVVGGAVRGGRGYGTLPEVGEGTDDDLGGGRLIPTIGVEQFSSTLAKWMGFGGSELEAVVPNIGRFDTDDLGFLTLDDTGGGTDGGSDGGGTDGGGTGGTGGTGGGSGSDGGMRIDRGGGGDFQQATRLSSR